MGILNQATLPLKRLFKAVQSILVSLRGILNRPIPPKYLPMTELLICINIAAYIAQVTIPQVTTVFVMRSSVWYSYLTGCFLHGNVAHLMGNMLFLSFIFPPLEKKYGSRFIFIAYCITGIFGSALFAFFLPNAQALGASGSIFGLMLVWVFHNLMEGNIILIFPALFYFMMEGVRSGIGLFMPDGVAHLGHYGSGLGAFFLIPLMLRKRK